MSGTGPSSAAEGQASGPVPPSRVATLAALEAEFLRATGPRKRAALQRKIRQLSAGTPADPARETAGRR
jgi:hypothetical protein